LTNLGFKLAEIQRRLVKQTSIESAYKEEMIRAMANIPAAHIIMKALPPSIISLEHRSMTNTMAGAISSITYDTSRELVMCAQPRDNWAQASPNKEGWVQVRL